MGIPGGGEMSGLTVLNGLDKRNSELMALIEDYRKTAIAEFFTCPKCSKRSGVKAHCLHTGPYEIACSCRCGYRWEVEQDVKPEDGSLV